MSTSNFKMQDGFPLYAMPDPYMKICPCCCIAQDTDVTTCEYCGADLSQEDETIDEIGCQIVYDEIESALAKECSELDYLDIEAIPGYYSGLQLFVKEQACNIESLYYDIPEKEADGIIEQEKQKVIEIMKKVANQFGMEKLKVLARFSNGETWYKKEGEKD